MKSVVVRGENHAEYGGPEFEETHPPTVICSKGCVVAWPIC